VVAEIYALIACSAPVQAFQVSSATGYARVVSQAAQQAYIASHRAQVISALAPAISAAGAGSVAVRAVAGPIGWASLAVSAGLVIAGMLYDSTERQQVKDNASVAAGNPQLPFYQDGTPATWQQPAGVTNPSVSSSCSSTPTPGCQWTIHVQEPTGRTISTCGSAGPTVVSELTARGYSFLGEAWNTTPAYCRQVYQLFYTGSNLGNSVTPHASPPTQQQVADYLASLPNNNALAPESQNQPVGTTGPVPTGSAVTTDIPVTPTQMPTTVVPANNVPAGSSVVDPNAPAPTQQTQTTQQSSTTTTTTNPDGSQTDQTTASVSCASGQHSNRTFGSVLQDHYDVWSASGLLGTLELLKNLSWPTTFPTYTLNSTVMGTFTFDFNAWSGVINALRALVIAGAGFVAYRIIFVGGH
jgi:hypothetical protein